MEMVLVKRFMVDWLTAYLSILASLIFSLFFCAFLRWPIFESEITTFNDEIKCKKKLIRKPPYQVVLN
jgi:hypothetical protein